MGRGLIVGGRSRGDCRLLFAAGEEALADSRARGEARSGRELADLGLYFRIPVPAGTRQAELESLVSALNALASVEIAYAQPPAVPPVDIPPVTPNFENLQDYLEAAPLGVDAYHAWTIPGGRGQGVRIVDVEGAWNTAHEDLPALFHQGGVQTTIPGWLPHGTAVPTADATHAHSALPTRPARPQPRILSLTAHSMRCTRHAVE